MWQLVLELLRNMVFFFGYFASGSFPKALSKQREEELFQKYRKENKDSEDFISIGTIGLIKAVNSFNPDKNIRLATYAVRCIENEILMVIRAEKKLVNEVSLEEPIGKDAEGNEISLIDILANDEESVFLEALKGIHQKKLYGAISSCLTRREREIILLRYGLLDKNPMPQREVAKKFGISRSYVSRIEKRALEKLKVALQND